MQQVQVRVCDWGGARLFEGGAELGPVQNAQWGFELRFRVENHEVARYQMRRGEQVRVRFAGARGDGFIAYIGRFGFEADAQFSAAGGHGRIQLVGEGPPPALGAGQP